MRSAGEGCLQAQVHEDTNNTTKNTNSIDFLPIFFLSIFSSMYYLSNCIHMRWYASKTGIRDKKELFSG